jgi:Domain of unknown function (DUF4314)
MPSRDWWASLSRACPVPAGTRIRLLATPDDPDPVAVGSEGTVVGGNGGQLWVHWDSGRTLSLIVGVDRYEVLPATDEEGERGS